VCVCVCVCHTGPLSRTTRVSRYQKGKTNLDMDFTEARDSEWQWCQVGQHPTTQFLQAGCPSCYCMLIVAEAWSSSGSISLRLLKFKASVFVVCCFHVFFYFVKVSSTSEKSASSVICSCQWLHF